MMLFVPYRPDFEIRTTSGPKLTLITIDGDNSDRRVFAEKRGFSRARRR
jgi:hypothetical protein